MFWSSVLGGFSVLTYWETYVVILLYLAAFLLPMIAIGFFMERRLEFAFGGGCLSILLISFIQISALGIAVLILFPIILGTNTDAAWSLPWLLLTTTPSSFLKLLLFMYIAAIGFSMLPVVGNWQSLQTAIIGSFAIGYLFRILSRARSDLMLDRIELVPDFWFGVGLFLIASAVSWLGMILVGFPLTLLSKDKEAASFFMIPLISVLGFLPLFMYGAWIGVQLQG